MTKSLKRATSALAAAAMVASGLTFASVTPANAAVGDCVAPTGTLTVFGFNDFHGSIENAEGTPVYPKAARFFTPVEEARAAAGTTDGVMLISQGDNIGGSIFTSMILDDRPTLESLKAIGVDSVTVGNHEFDMGFADLAGRAIPMSGVPHLGANVYTKGTTTVAAPLKAYEIFERAGLRVAVVGAVTGDVPSLVSPAGIADLDFGDPVDAVNRVTAQLLDGDDANGEADIVLASFHEGAALSSLTAAENAENSGAFARILNDVDPRVSAIFNAHTHQSYSYVTHTGVPVIQAKSHADQLAKVTLTVDAINGGVCGTAATHVSTPGAAGTTDALVELVAIQEGAAAQAAPLGAEVIGSAAKAVSTPEAGGSSTRNHESPMSNAVAQMFHEVLSDGDAEFIGVQNPGGTRASFDVGDITFKEAATVLPFANSLYTTQLTGTQFKAVLEQQWQRDPSGVVPSRPYLALGLSDNVSYTYDESRPEGDRITSIAINRAPIDPSKLYTFGSGSFLISGGDNFREFMEGVNTADTGLADLESMVGWVRSRGAITPDYSKRGVSSKLPPSNSSLVEGGAGLTFTFGQPLAGGVALGTLDMFLNATGDRVSPQLPNTEIVATIGDVVVGDAPVKDGVGTIEVRLARSSGAADGAQILTFTVLESGTEIHVPVTVVDRAGPVIAPVGAQSGAVGTPVAIKVTGTDPTTPVTFAAAGLPSGLTINPATGVISGTPTVDGTFTITVIATDGAGNVSTPVSFTMVIKPKAVVPQKPGFNRTAPYTLPGVHKNLNGRDWLTTCEPYSQTERCTTLIWGTKVQLVNGRFVQSNGWQFNNLTYLPASQSLWGANPLANTGEFVSAGRNWETECRTPRTGGDACRTYVQANVIEAIPGGGYRQVTKYVFNNIVMFSN